MATTPTANDLRRLAEAADGMRGETVCLVDAGKYFDVVPSHDVGDKPVILSMLTPNDGSNLQGATFTISHGGVEYTNPNVDAIFLSQSAVEKFLLPYYARFQTPRELEQIRDRLYHTPGVVAAVHEFPTIVMGVSPARAVQFTPSTERFSLV